MGGGGGGGGGGGRDDELLPAAALLQQALEGHELGAGRDALHAMALAAAAHAALAASPPPRSPGVLKMARGAHSPTPSPPASSAGPPANGVHDSDEDHVEDLSCRRVDPPSQESTGVIVPPMNQVSAIIKKEDALRDYQEDSRRSLSVDCSDRE